MTASSWWTAGAEPDTLELAATDGHRLGVMNAWGRLPEGIERVFIPKAACSLMAKWGQALRITPPQPGSQLWLCSDFDGWIVGFTLAEDGVRFPDYRRISGIMVPDGNGGFHTKGERTLILDRAALLLAVNTVLPATNEKTNGMWIKLDGAMLRLEPAGVEHDLLISEAIPVRLDSAEPFTFEPIAFNARYLRDAILNTSTATVKLTNIGKDSPLFLTAERHGVDFEPRFVIMPMRG